MQRRILTPLILLAFLAVALGAVQFFHHHDSHHDDSHECQVCFWLTIGMAVAILLAATLWLEERRPANFLPITNDILSFQGRPRSASSRAPPSSF